MCVSACVRVNIMCRWAVLCFAKSVVSGNDILFVLLDHDIYFSFVLFFAVNSVQLALLGLISLISFADSVDDPSNRRDLLSHGDAQGVLSALQVCMFADCP